MLTGLFDAPHIIILIAVLFLLFGAKRMPDASRSLARSMKIFKNEVKDLRSDDDDTVTPEIASTPVVKAPVSSGATAVTQTPAAPVIAAPVIAAPVVGSAAADEIALREAELRLAEAKVNELRARAAAQSEHERV